MPETIYQRRIRRRDELLRHLSAWQLADLLVDQEFEDEGRDRDGGEKNEM